MSREPGDPRLPRKPKPPGDPAPRPKARAGDEEASTFRPNPRRAKAPTATTESVSAASGKREHGTGDPPKLFERVLFGRVSSGQLASFCRQFAAYLHAGVDISKALSSLQSQFARTALGPVIGRLLVSVKQGEALAEGAEREPQAFDPLFLSMIRVAEARGGVPETLKMMSRHYEARQRMIRQARSALIYPACVIFVALCVGAIITIYTIPKFALLLADITKGAALPLPSRVLMAFSGFIQTVGWLLIPIIIIGTPIVLFQLYKTEKGKRIMDAVALRFPVLGPLLKKLDTLRFARTLSALLNAGVDVGSSLDLTADVMRLHPFRRAIKRSRSLVIQGEELSVALDGNRVFESDVIAVLNSGEETGKIPESLVHVADDYEQQVEYTIKNLGQLVQPIITVVLGLIVLFIILAVFLPIISVINSLANPGH